MAYSNAWNEAYPPGTLSADQIDTAIQYWAVAIRERLNDVFGIANWASADPIRPGSMHFGGATPYIIGGSSYFIFRDQTNSFDNVAISDSGDITSRRHLISGSNLISSANLVFNAASPKVLPGSNGIFFRNYADAANVAVLTDLGLSITGVFAVSGISSLHETNVTGQGYTIRYNAGNSGAALAIDWANGNNQKVDLTANWTPTLANPKSGAVYVLELIQDGTGTRTVTWPASVHWPNGTAPTLTTTVNKTDIITLYYNGTNYLGSTGGFNYV